MLKGNALFGFSDGPQKHASCFQRRESQWFSEFAGAGIRSSPQKKLMSEAAVGLY
jgi:hypothetical protein